MEHPQGSLSANLYNAVYSSIFQSHFCRLANRCSQELGNLSKDAEVRGGKRIGT